MTMQRTPENRNVEFRPRRDGALERTVTRADGRHYEHRCWWGAFERIAKHLDDHGDQGFTVFGIAKALDIPYTQATVAIDFLAERGLVITDAKRRYAADGYRVAFYEHAMTEWYALIGGHPPTQR